MNFAVGLKMDLLFVQAGRTEEFQPLNITVFSSLKVHCRKIIFVNAKFIKACNKYSGQFIKALAVMVHELKDNVEQIHKEFRLFKQSVTDTFKMTNRHAFANATKASKIEEKFQKFENTYKEFQKQQQQLQQQQLQQQQHLNVDDDESSYSLSEWENNNESDN